MSHFYHYQSVPTAGRLLYRLANEPAFHRMYCALLHHPRGPFDALRLGGSHLGGLVEGVVRHGVFDGLPSAELALAELRCELTAAAAANAGLERRSAYVQLRDEFEDWIAQELARVGRHDSFEYAVRLVSGTEPLGVGLFPGHVSELQWNEPNVLSEAADWLGRIDPVRVASAEPEYRDWHRMYLAAAEHGEAVVIG